MSIVEKAIAKLQRNVATDVPLPKTVPVQIAAPTVVDSHGPIESAAIAVGSHATIDFKVLQAAGMLPPEQGSMAVRNQFRRLKWLLLDEITASRTRHLANAGAFMITSALPGEGKTFTSVNLALSLAREENRQVILVDADVAKGHISQVFGLRDRKGLVDLLANPSLPLSDALVATSIERLYVLPSGKFRSNIADLMSGARMVQLLSELVGSDGSRIVVFDTSPVLATNVAQVLGRVLPQTLLVVRAENTPQAAVLEAIELLDRSKVAAVLNQSNLSAVKDAYNQRYGYYANEEE